ncbi:uncharacterized protein N7479_008481 [Penicillium vulpinum]|uniref:G-patch domain-containing protein n=1 Tax=Penicillium vulpinum TaxID=29845 RepID=A0A1V6RMR0_9EURO|nr:uncharacterized protein N7479_008481 [Penicillium vulpinum]KAJ5961331.1 hypothetical protein N7479_008481 [Penicillium vulpinum]OQE02890.1 hypothetical protein PENVUL_c037G05539 [Penicillium vulpinum]
MDAQAYLIKHGWSGPGNPLNPNKRPGAHSGLGLTRPLLVSRKANNHGVGKKTTKDPTNQWWLRGFEDALKGVGNDSFEATSARENNALTSELYRHFVRGDGLAGTLEGAEKKKDDNGTSTSKSKRKRENEDDGLDRKAKKLAKAARKLEKAERKEGRRVKRAAKAEKKEKKAAEKLAKKALKEKKRTASEEEYPTPTSIDQESDQTGAETTETDEAVTRLEEKTTKKEKKESKKIKSTGSEVDAEVLKKKFKKEKKDRKEAKA